MPTIKKTKKKLPPTKTKTKTATKKRTSRKKPATSPSKQNVLFSIEVFDALSMPFKRKQEIRDQADHFCRRGTSYISPEWISHGLGLAPLVIMAIDDNNKVCAFLIAYDYDKMDIRNEELDFEDKLREDVWTLDTICRHADSKFKTVTPLMIESLIAIARKNGVTRIHLFATTDESAEAYKRYGFKITKKTRGEKGAEMSLVI